MESSKKGEVMASWLKAKLFGRQLSYGSESEDPQSFEEALQQQAVPNVALTNNVVSCKNNFYC